MPRILVTGASGFVGRAVVADLTEHAIEVTVAGRAMQRLQNMFPSAPAIRLDLDEPASFTPQAFEGIDCVMHLAARVHVMRSSADDEQRFERANVAATVALARCAAGAGVRRFVYLSSIKVNGEQTTVRPYSHDDAPAPCDAYGRSKARAEEELRAVSRATGMEVACVRPPLVYGPHVGANFQRLIRLVHANVPLPFRSLPNKRSLIGLSNLAPFLRHVVAHPKAAGRSWLVSDGCDVSTAELCEAIAGAMGKRARLIRVPLVLLRCGALLTRTQAELTRLTSSLQIDVSHTCRELEWAPPVSLAGEIKRTVTWFLESQRAAD